MENWDLIPYKSVGPIDFKDTKEDIINYNKSHNITYYIDSSTINIIYNIVCY